jgi:hypothetical protein
VDDETARSLLTGDYSAFNLVVDEIFECGVSLAGVTHGDNVRHEIVRSAFMNALLQDERVRDLFDTWWQRVGGPEKARAIAEVLRERMEMLSRAKDAPQGEADRAIESIAADLQRMREALVADLASCPDLVSESFAFVKSVGLPWPWVGTDLMKCFVIGTAASVFNEQIEFRTWVEDDDPPAVALEFHFATREGETVGQALARLSEDVDLFRRKLAVPPRPRGTIPKATVRALQRNAIWFYRAEVMGEPILSIARSEFDEDGPKRRKDVRGGIARAKQLLGLVQYEFRDPPREPSDRPNSGIRRSWPFEASPIR